MRRKSPSVEDLVGRALPQVDSMGLMIFDPIWGQRDHVDQVAELIHVIRGDMSLIMRRRRYDARAGDTLVVPPHTAHRDWFDPEKGLEVFMVFFRWKPAREFFSRVGNRTLLAMPAGRKREIGRIVDRLRMDRADGEREAGLVVRSRLATILMLMLREATERRRRPAKSSSGALRRRRRRQLINNAKEYLRDHMRECVSLHQVARELRVSPYYLSHVFSEENEFSLFSYLTTLRMEKAKALLSEGRLNVSETAFAVGFANPNYFSKVFRRYFGRSPRDCLGDSTKRRGA